MKTCVIFRGENLRHKRGYTSALDGYDNWKEAIFDVIDCDIALFTYPSVILEQLIEKMKPIHVCTTGFPSQDESMGVIVEWMIENKSKYDRFVISRFDVMYRKRITEWPHWEKKGAIVVNKDVHYPTDRLYADVVFVIDSDYLSQFKEAYVAHGKYRVALHHIGRYLEEMPDVPFHVMFSDYFAITRNPLHAMFPEEDRPNLDEDYDGDKIIDVSRWNWSVS